MCMATMYWESIAQKNVWQEDLFPTCRDSLLVRVRVRMANYVES